MAWLDNNSQISFGKYKGMKVCNINDCTYVKSLHEGLCNIFFTEEVFRRLGVTHKGKRKESK